MNTTSMKTESFLPPRRVELSEEEVDALAHFLASADIGFNETGRILRRLFARLCAAMNVAREKR